MPWTWHQNDVTINHWRICRSLRIFDPKFVRNYFKSSFDFSIDHYCVFHRRRSAILRNFLDVHFKTAHYLNLVIKQKKLGNSFNGVIKCNTTYEHVNHKNKNEWKKDKSVNQTSLIIIPNFVHHYCTKNMYLDGDDLYFKSVNGFIIDDHLSLIGFQHKFPIIWSPTIIIIAIIHRGHILSVLPKKKRNFKVCSE